MEGRKLIFAKSPTEFFSWVPKKANFSKKIKKWPILAVFDNKNCRKAKIMHFNQIFWHPPIQIIIEEQSVKISIIYVLINFQYSTF